jgi:ribonucleotide reductase beta subunit family protein with ferritin-like domain
MAANNQEEILSEVGNRFVMFPIRYNAIWSIYKKAESAFWTAEEVDLSKDINDWEKLNENEKHYIKHILAFFAASDGIVNENLGARFFNEVKAPEAKAFYGFQIAMENIHCVSADTEILTREGYQAIGYLNQRNPSVEVWNGDSFSKVDIVKTSDKADLFMVKLSNGMFLKCTSKHKWLIQGVEDRVFTEDLKEGMLLQEFEYPVMDHITDPMMFANPYEHGLICGQDDAIPYDIREFNMVPRYFVPVNYGRDTKVAWLSGLFKSASVSDGEIEFRSINVEFIKSVQMLLTSFNVHTTVTDGVLSADVYNTYLIAKCGATIFDEETTKSILDKTPAYTKKNITVMSVTQLPNPGPTYCFNEPINHTGLFNGILTGQSEMYSLLIDSYIKDAKEREHLFNAIDTVPSIRKKADWALKWIENQEASFATRLVAFACVEGIFFSGAFCSIFWLKERGVMPGLCLSNEFISRDEGLHTEFAVLLYSMLHEKLPQETIHDIVKDAVEIEDEFINVSIPCNLLGMNADLMSTYIRFVADRLIVQLGCEPIWNVKNPFDFMDRIALENKSNFFEHTRISEYAKANVGVSTTDAFKFSLNEEF